MSSVPPATRYGPAPGCQRLRLRLAYDGAPWRGWQSMPGGRTVQDELNAAFQNVTGTPVRTQGSGRTDAGVHALAQVAHADVPDSVSLPPSDWINALNRHLPPSIRVLDVSQPAPDFHARFDATGKIYRYRIWRPRVLSPFESGRAWHVYGRLDLDLLLTGAKALTGTHDFARLSAFRGGEKEIAQRDDPATTTRTLRRIEVLETPTDVLEIEFEGDGFLYKMARLLTGSLIQVARGRASLDWLQDLIDNPRANPKSHHAAPADGLYLVEVRYD